MRRLTLGFAALCALAACGKEVGRVPLSSVGTAEATIDLSAGDVAFWTDMDLEWQGDASLEYVVTLTQDGQPVATATCHPLGQLRVKGEWTSTNLGDAHTRHGSGKMSCEATVPKAGKTAVQVTLAWKPAPKDSTLRKVDLVLKQ